MRDSGTPLVLYGRLYTNYQLCVDEVDTFADKQDDSVISRGDEVVVPASGETAEDIAVASHIRTSGLILGGDLNIVRPNDKIDPSFLALALTNSAARIDLAKRAQGKSIVHIHNSDIAEVVVSFPSLEEQRIVALVALRFDDLITLHQRKYATKMPRQNQPAPPR